VTVAPYLYSRRKRALDVVLSGGALLVAAPILAIAAAAVRLESHGHPIYRQPRVGKDGHDFEVIKLRTMVSGAERMGAGMAVDEGDARITRVGALLRRTSIDELVNLVNVLRGEMSLIGPRPTPQNALEPRRTAAAREDGKFPRPGRIDQTSQC